MKMKINRDVHIQFYDIESTQNVFLLSLYIPPREKDVDGKAWPKGHIDTFYICDNDSLDLEPVDVRRAAAGIARKKNRNFDGSLTLRNLKKKDNLFRLARTFGLCRTRYVNATPESPEKDADGAEISPFRIVCDTDPDYQEKYDNKLAPYFAGYNSNEYDLTMLAWLFFRTCIKPYGAIKDDGELVDENGDPFNPYLAANQRYISDNDDVELVSAREMRQLNNILFSYYHKSMHRAMMYSTFDDMERVAAGEKAIYGEKGTAYVIWKNFKMTGRHIDVAMLPGKQVFLAEKRLLGMLGYQILESDKIRDDSAIENMDQMLDLIAYNVSDIVNLELLFYTDTYHAPFELKKGLLDTYKELIYGPKSVLFKRRNFTMPAAKAGTFSEEHHAYDQYAPCISPKHVRSDRLNIDDTSASFATLTLCPYGKLTDIEYVSFLYPDAEEAKALHVKQVDVLEETKKFVEENFVGEKFADARKAFQGVYDYYASIRGHNFDDGELYRKTYGHKCDALSDRSLFNFNGKNCIPYYDANGNPTTCYATFSVGGIHGAEYNKALYEADVKAYEKRVADYKLLCKKVAYVKKVFPDANVFCAKKKNAAGKQIRGEEGIKTLAMPDGTIIRADEVSGKGAVAKGTKQYVEPVLRGGRPALFVPIRPGSDSYALSKRYAITSCDPVNHEDFTSYYPNLLRRMRAFWNNGLGYDRYGVIFDLKQEYGRLMKTAKTPEEKKKYSILRSGTKLILNSVSGVADATFDNAVRMNNRIISMRIIGQLFTYRIAQAQALHGARITSTNTDGLYSVLEENLNNQILEQQSKSIGVEIEPEPLYLITKDANNRIECTKTDSGLVITAAGGATTGCRLGPNLGKSIDHPAVIDWALSEYLCCAALGKGTSMQSEFNEELGMKILQRAVSGECVSENRMSKEAMTLVMFQMIAASSPSSHSYIYGVTNDGRPVFLSRFSRVFFMDEPSKNTIHLCKAMARIYNPASDAAGDSDAGQDDFDAVRVLEASGDPIEKIRETDPSRVAKIVKISRIETEWNTLVENRNLDELSDEEKSQLLKHLDLKCYLEMLKNSYESSWRNVIPEEC